jgi:Protein of unknown function (DUF3540)
MLAAVETMSYLGPAKVLLSTPGRVKLHVFEDKVWAVMALAGPYQPAVGDTVLTIAQAGAWYVIGVIDGKGKSTLTVPGDLRIEAPQGRIELSAAKGIRVKSDEVSIVAGRWNVSARSAIERLGEATRWVKGAWQVRVGRMRTCVRDDYDLQAERILQRAEQDVRIDGSKINLG